MEDRSETMARKQGRGLFITGTDTGVGKTLVASALGLGLEALGQGPVCVMKPVETGCRLRNGKRVPHDARFHRRMLMLSETEESLCPVRLRYPLAPLSAAELEGRTLKKTDWLPAFKRLQERYGFVLVEGAGGAMVPLSMSCMMSDMAMDLKVPCVVVARTALGTINHTLLTVEHLRSKGVPVLGLVFNRVGVPGRASLAEVTGPELASSLASVPVLGTMPRMVAVTRKALAAAGTGMAQRLVTLLDGGA